MRNALLMLAGVTVAAAGVFTADGMAQGGSGVIYYKYGPAQSCFRVNATGSDNRSLGFSRVVAGTWLDSYPGGRQFVTDSGRLGPIPGWPDGYFGDIVLVGEQNGVATSVTAFRGPEYVNQNGIRARVSNDGRDSFLSFVVYDSRTGSHHLVRYNGPISDFFQPGFVAPQSTDDPRLLVARNIGAWEQFNWDSTGTKLIVTDTHNSGAKTYALDIASNSLSLINDPLASGLEFSRPYASPTEFRLFAPARHSDGTKGIVSFYPETGQWSWVIKEGGKGNKKISSFGTVGTSPDGSTITFGLLRIVNNRTVPSLVRVPASGGSFTTLVTYTDSAVNTFMAASPGWR
jgi:hypothetical protein